MKYCWNLKQSFHQIWSNLSSHHHLVLGSSKMTRLATYSCWRVHNCFVFAYDGALLPHELACSSLSLHEVPWDCMPFHEFACWSLLLLNKHCKILVSCSDKERNWMQAHENVCRVKYINMKNPLFFKKLAKSKVIYFTLQTSYEDQNCSEFHNDHYSTSCNPNQTKTGV